MVNVVDLSPIGALVVRVCLEGCSGKPGDGGGGDKGLGVLWGWMQVCLST